MNKILVTPRSLTKGGHPALELLKKAGYEVVFSTPGKQPDEDELMRLLPDCVGYLAGVEKVSSKVLEAAKGLKVISRNGTGVDNIDLEAAARLGVRICRAEGANAMGVAELTIGLMFALVRLIPFHDDMMKKGKWERRKGCELRGRTLGLIGCGQIGKEVALRALGLGMEVLAYRRNPDRSFSPSEKFRWVTFDELVERSHIISLHLPATTTGEPVITSGVIARMKKGVYLINTARASLIDEKAVLNALDDGQIAGFATDVYSEEPPKDLTLVKHERIISTPHLGGFTDESVDRATEEAVRNLLNSL